MATDNFTYADGSDLAVASGGVWANMLNPLPVASNAVVKPTTANVDCYPYYATSTGSNNNWSEAFISTFAGVPNYANLGVTCRVNPTDPGGTCYLAARETNGDIVLYSLLNGTYSASALGTFILAASAPGALMRIEANGSTITVSWNGSVVISVTNTTITTGAYTGITGSWDGTPGITGIFIDTWTGSGPSGGGASAQTITGTAGTVVVSGVTRPPSVDQAIVASAPGSITVSGVSTAPTSVLGPQTIAGNVGTITVGGVSAAPQALLVIAGSVGSIVVVGVTRPPALVAPVRYPAAITSRKIVDQAGSPYLLFSFTSWGITNLANRSDITTALQGLVTNGFNGVCFWIGGTYTAGGWSMYTNGEGNAWWAGTVWGSALGPAWTQVDFILDECERLGLVAVMSFNSSNTGPDWDARTNAQMSAAGSAIATRYLARPNILWHVMFDDNPGTPTTAPGSTRGQRAKAIFQGINGVEGSTRRPVRLMEPARQDNNYTAGWVTDPDIAVMNCFYEYGGNSTEIIEASYTQTGATTYATGDPEPPYDGAPHYSGSRPQQLRERTYAVFLEGGAYAQYGHEDWWPFGASGIFTEGLTWPQVITDVHTVEQRYAHTVLNRYAANSTWAPSSTFVVTGTGSGDTKAAVGASSIAGVAYFPDNRSVVVNTTIISSGSVRLRWYDPTAGTYTIIASSEAPSASRTVTYPGNHADGTSDYVLVLDVPVLDVDDAYHGHIATSPAVIGIANLIVADALHGHIATSPAVAPFSNVSLVVNDGFHVHTSPDPVLAFGTSLVVNDTLHGHIATSPLLTTLVVLTIDDAFHRVVSTRPIITIVGATTVTADLVFELTMRAGDRLPMLAVAIEDELGRPLDMTDAVGADFVLLHEDGIWPLTTPQPAGASHTLTLPGLIIDVSSATVAYDWEAFIVDLVPGVYDLSVVVRYADTGTVTSPSDNIGRIYMRPAVLSP